MYRLCVETVQSLRCGRRQLLWVTANLFAYEIKPNCHYSEAERSLLLKSHFCKCGLIVPMKLRRGGLCVCVGTRKMAEFSLILLDGYRSDEKVQKKEMLLDF